MTQIPPEVLSSAAGAAIGASTALVAKSGVVVSDALAGMTERALRPIRLRVHEWRQTEERLKREIDERLAARGVTQPVSPEASVALPAVHAALFVGDDLRSLFARLLATAMDPATAEEAHPAFVEFIKQLLPDEARLLSVFRSPEDALVVQVSSEWSQPGVEIRAVIQDEPLGDEARLDRPRRLKLYLANLERLGLVQRKPVFWDYPALVLLERDTSDSVLMELAGTYEDSLEVIKAELDNAAWLRSYVAQRSLTLSEGQLFRLSASEEAAATARAGRQLQKCSATVLELTRLGRAFVAACVA